MQIDLTWAEHFVLATAGLVLTACAPLLTGWVRTHLRIAAGSALSTDLGNAVTAAAQLALDAISSVAEHNRTIELHNSAVAMGVKYVLGAAPAAVTALGLTPDHLAAMVSGEVSKALGARPQPKSTVTAPTPVSTPASAPAPTA